MKTNSSLTKLLVGVTVSAAIVFSLVASLVGRPTIIRDALAYNVSAQRLVSTGTYEYSAGNLDPTKVDSPNAFTMPGYTLFLAAFYLFLPHGANAVANTTGAQPVIIAVQLLLAIVTAVLVALGAYRLGGKALGWTAGILTVAYLPFGMNATITLTEPLALALMAVVMLSAIELFRKRHQPLDRQTLLWAFSFGLSGGLSILVRPTIALWLLLPLGTWLWLEKADLRKITAVAATACLTIALCMTPWIVRNAVVLHRFIPLTASASTPLLDSIGGATFTPEEAKVVAVAEKNAKDGNYVVAMNRLSARWKASPQEFIWWKLSTLWNGSSNITNLPFDVIADIQISGAPAEGHYAGPTDFLSKRPPSFYLCLFSWMTWYHRLLIALALLGVALGWRRPIVWLLASVPVYYALVHVAILFMVRYFYPAVPALILLAAFGCVGTYKLTKGYLASFTAAS